MRPEAGYVRRALITAAGTDSRKLPLQHLFDARGAWKSADQLLELMIRTKRRFEEALPFAMDPVVYDFQINENGSHARLGGSGLMPDAYYLMMLPRWLRQDPRSLDAGTRREMDHFAREKLGPGAPLGSEVVRRIFPQPGSVGAEGAGEGIAGLLARLGFPLYRPGGWRL